MENTRPALSLSHITVTYNETPALWNVSLDVPKHILGAVIGPNGAGKTTLLKAILGLVSPVSGAVHSYDTTMARKPHIAYVPQRRSVDWDFPVTVIDVVMMGAYWRLGWFARPSYEEYEKAYAVLEQVALRGYAHRHISQLSGGQQQRVFLARALLQDADIYLLDEPFVGVDKKSEATIVDILGDLRAAGKTLLVVHHDLYTVRAYFDWVVLLNVELIGAGPIGQVYTKELLAQTYETTHDMSTAFTKETE